MNRASAGYNAEGLLETVTLSGGAKTELLQKMEYDSQKRLKVLSLQNGNKQILDYDGDSDFLIGISDQAGVKTRRDALDERDLAKVMSTFRGENIYQLHQAFGPFDFLSARWDSLGGTAESPLTRFRYEWPDATRPGQVATLENNLMGGFAESIELLSGTGKKLGRLNRNENHAWVSSGLSRFDLKNLRSTNFARKISDDSTLRDVQVFFTESVGESIESPVQLDTPIEAWSTVQKDVLKSSKSQVSVRDGMLYLEEVSNSKRSKTFVLNSEQVKVKDIDGEGYAYAYEYDDLNRFKRVVLPSAKTIEVSYDEMGRVGHVLSSFAGSMEKTYNTMGLLAVRTHFDQNGKESRRWTFHYDSKGRVISKKALADDKVLEQQLHYDGRMPDGSIVPGQLGQLSSVVGAEYTKTFVYDLKGRLVKATLNLPKDAIMIAKEMNYDALDRKIQLKVESNVRGRITRHERKLGYDELGREKSLEFGSQKLDLFYDDFNQLKRIEGARKTFASKKLR